MFGAWLKSNIHILLFLFAENVDKGVICQLELDEAKVKQFKDAIENNYWFEFFVGMFCTVFFYVMHDETMVLSVNIKMFIQYTCKFHKKMMLKMHGSLDHILYFEF